MVAGHLSEPQAKLEKIYISKKNAKLIPVMISITSQSFHSLVTMDNNKLKINIQLL
jgi:hypothetical protein